MQPKQPDIFNNDDDYQEYLQKKEQFEQEKQFRIDKLLDEYCYTQMNLPASEYRSHQTDLIYKPMRYPIQVHHPFKEDSNSPYVGFNQHSNIEVFRRHKHVKTVPQKLHYSYQPQQQQQPFVNPYQYPPNNPTQMFTQSQLIPSLGLNQGNLFYQQQQFSNPMEAQQQASEVYSLGQGRAINEQRKKEFITRSNYLERRVNNILRNDEYKEFKDYY